MSDLDSIEKSFASKVFQALSTWLAKVRDAVMSAWNKHKTTPNPQAVATTQPLWLRLLDGLENELKAAAAAGWKDVSQTPLPADQQFISQQLALTHRLLVGIPDEVQDLIQREINTAVSQGDAPDAIARRVDLLLSATGSQRWQNRAQVIATTEVHRMANAARQAAAMQVQRIEGDPHLTKKWLAHRDERTRADHRDADGQVVPLNEAFTVGDGPMLYPGDPAAPAEQVVNCRCSMGIRDGKGNDL